MTTPRRYRISRQKGARWPPNTIKCDRSTKRGNPFMVGVHGTREECVQRCDDLLTRGLVTMTDRKHVEQQRDYRAYVLANLASWRARNMACWCPENVPCHVDTLLRLANPILCEEA